MMMMVYFLYGNLHFHDMFAFAALINRLGKHKLSNETKLKNSHICMILLCSDKVDTRPENTYTFNAPSSHKQVTLS